EGEEFLEDPLGRIAEGLQQDRHRHLAAPVDAEEHDVLGIELEIEPRAAVRDDARGEQQLAARVRLAAVVLEEHPRRAVQLRHDHPLGAVDDERTRGRHERNLAHVDLLLLHFLGGRLGRLLVHDHEAHLRAQRARIGQAALLALLDVERRLAQRIADELQARVLRVAHDREDRGKRRLQALVLAPLGRHVRLEECRVGLELGRDEERHFLHDRPLREALADAFTLGQRIGHLGSWPPLEKTKEKPPTERVFALSSVPGGPFGPAPDSEVPYLISAFAPASISFFNTASASAFDTPSFTALGAPSTRSFASLRPRLVTSRTALMTLTLLSPMAVSITVNSVFSSAGAVAAAPPPAAGAATGSAAAAGTPHLSSMSLMR